MGEMNSTELAAGLSPVDRRALLAKPGSGDFSTAAWRRLVDAGLMDKQFWPTELGWSVRKALGDAR